MTSMFRPEFMSTTAANTKSTMQGYRVQGFGSDGLESLMMFSFSNSDDFVSKITNSSNSNWYDVWTVCISCKYDKRRGDDCYFSVPVTHNGAIPFRSFPRKSTSCPKLPTSPDEKSCN